MFSDDWAHPVGPIVVEGRSGIGKTALVKAACKIAADAGWTVLQTRGEDPRRSAQPSVLVQLLASHVRGAENKPAEAQSGDVTSKLDAIVTELATAHGVVIAVDDAQWLDQESSDWLYGFERNGLKRRRLIVGLASRSPGAALRPVEEILSEPSARVMALGPLSAESVAALALEYFGMPVDEEFCSACYEETGGYPSLVFALFRELALERVAPSMSGLDRVRAVISAAVARSVIGRLSALEPEAARVLDAVAVAGNPVDVDLVAEVTQLPVGRAGAAADSLGAVDLLVPGRPLSFQQPLVRRTVYAEIAPAWRAELHVRMAKILKIRGAPIQELADHLAAAEPGRDEWVADQLEEAGTLALRQGASVQAVRYLARALAEQPSESRRDEMLLHLAQAEAGVDAGSAQAHLCRSLELGVEPTRIAAASLEVARRCQDLAARTELGTFLGRVATLLSDDERVTRIELLVAALLVSRSPGEAAAAAEALGSAVESSSELGSTAEREAIALSAVVDIGRAGAVPSEIATTVRRALLGEEIVSHNPLRCELWARSLLALARAGEFEEADLHARQAQAVARSHDLELAEAEFSTTLAVSLALQGSLAEAEAQARRALTVSGDLPWSRRPEAAACLVGVLLDSGRRDDADEVVAMFDPGLLPSSSFEGQALREQRGRIRTAQGRFAEGLADLLAAGRQAEEHGVDSPLVTSWRSEAALALAKEGHESEAVRHADAHLELARANGTSWVVGSALHVLAVVGEATQRLQRLEEAVTLLENSPAQLRLASALIDLGHELREAGAPPATARSTLRRGADLALRSGAAPLLAKAAAELRSSGARPRRLALSGTEALTSSEHRVVALAAKGFTNSEIARQLFLAEKTVEGHLLRAYRKLEVRSRRELKTVYSGDLAEDTPDSPSSHVPS